MPKEPSEWLVLKELSERNVPNVPNEQKNRNGQKDLRAPAEIKFIFFESINKGRNVRPLFDLGVWSMKKQELNYFS